MKDSDSPIPRRNDNETQTDNQLSDSSDEIRQAPQEVSDQTEKLAETENQQNASEHADKRNEKPAPHSDKKKKKRNLWPLKAMIISLLLAFAVNALSSFSLSGARLWVAIVVTVLILILGVLFDMIGTAATSCDIGPFLAMASRKVKGGKTAVKLAKKRDIVSSVCCDIVGDICGIVSGVCAAIIALGVKFDTSADFWISVAIYAVISTATITLKAAGKSVAVKNANGIVFAVAKILSIFSKKG